MKYTEVEQIVSPESIESLHQNWQELQQWYRSDLGTELANEENRMLETVLPNLFGYYLLQCGCPDLHFSADTDWLVSSRISRKYKLDPNHLPQGTALSQNYIYSQSYFETLPVKADSLDAVILPHSLEFSLSPHQVLREVERVLIPEGHVVIMGFNPFSIWSLFRFVGLRKGALKGNFLSCARVIDWLHLLGFDIVKRKGYFFRPPLQHVGVMEKLSFLERLGKRWWPRCGAGYVLVAKKRVVTFTPIKTPWRSKQSVIHKGFEVTNRNQF